MIGMQDQDLFHRIGNGWADFVFFSISARAPELFAVAGGLVIAALAWPEDFVLFSGQQAIQHLDGLSDGTLVYIAVAKWAALCVAFVAGWRGGPIFPTFTSVAALAVIASGVVDIGYDVAIIGATTAVSVVFLKGKVAAAFVLSLYVAPLSYAGVIIVGCVSSAGALALARRARVLPSAPAAAAPAQPTT